MVYLSEQRSRQTETKAQILKKSSIIVDRFLCCFCLNIAYAQTTHFGRSSNVNNRMGFRNWPFVETDGTMLRVTFMDLLLFMYWVGCSSASVFKKTQTLYTLYERHTYSICIRCKGAQSVQNNNDTLKILVKNKKLVFCDCCFLFSLSQTFNCNV